jgi:hypothetical protein
MQDAVVKRSLVEMVGRKEWRMQVRAGLCGTKRRGGGEVVALSSFLFPTRSRMLSQRAKVRVKGDPRRRLPAGANPIEANRGGCGRRSRRKRHVPRLMAQNGGYQLSTDDERESREVKMHTRGRRGICAGSYCSGRANGIAFDKYRWRATDGDSWGVY